MLLPAQLMIRGPIAMNLTVLVAANKELDGAELSANMLQVDGMNSINYVMGLRPDLKNVVYVVPLNVILDEF